MFLALQNLGLVYYFYPCYFVFLVQLIHSLFFQLHLFHDVQGRPANILYPYLLLINSNYLNCSYLVVFSFEHTKVSSLLLCIIYCYH